MGRSALQIAQELTAGAERAQQAGDTVASLVLAIKAAEYLQLSRLLGDALTPQDREAQG